MRRKDKEEGSGGRIRRMWREDQMRGSECRVKSKDEDG